MMRRSASVYTIYFQSYNKFVGLLLAGFSETNGVVYAKFHKSIIRITVLYELIKGITVPYMPNQVHNCAVWLIQYSYAVDYYFMSYTAHFFALVLPHKVQYLEVNSNLGNILE